MARCKIAKKLFVRHVAFLQHQTFLNTTSDLLPVPSLVSWPKEIVKTDALCHSRCGTLKNPHCSMAISAEYRSKFAALHRQLVMSSYKWNNLEWDVKQQLNKQKWSKLLWIVLCYCYTLCEMICLLSLGVDNNTLQLRFFYHFVLLAQINSITLPIPFMTQIP